MKKKLISLLLVVVLTLTMVACGSSGDENGDKEANNGSASNGPAYVTEPITINFWHIFGSGETADYMNDAVKRFNETNEYDITVNATSVGSYSTLRSQLTTSIGAGDNPQIVMLGFSDIMASAGVLVDMTPYAERDNLELGSYWDGVETSMYYDGQLTGLPFVRSCTMLYYNVDMFKQAGFETAPKTVDEMVTMCKAVSQKTGAYGLEMLLDVSFQQEALLRSLGSDGLIDEDKQGAGCLEDGSMLKLMTDWSKWIEEGWCLAPTVADAQNKMLQKMYSGELAACTASSALIGTLTKYGAESGQNIVGVAMPTYDGSSGVGGGGDISIINANNDEQQIAAAWEFAKFLMSDEEVATRSEITGYLPTSQGAADLMADVFETNVSLKNAYEERLKCVDVAGGIERSEWQTQVNAAFSYVIQDKSMTPEEGIEYLKDMLPTVFY